MIVYQRLTNVFHVPDGTPFQEAQDMVNSHGTDNLIDVLDVDYRFFAVAGEEVQNELINPEDPPNMALWPRLV